MLEPKSVLKSAVLRHLVVPGLVLLLGLGSAFAQSGDNNHAQDQSGKPAAATPSDAAKENQRKIDQFGEAAQAINGPAGNPECVWLGRRVVQLVWVDDLDTAFRHLDLYDRFGCPGGHIQAAFRCLTRFGAQIDDKVPRQPERPRSRLLDQPRRPAAAGRGGRSCGPHHGGIGCAGAGGPASHARSRAYALAATSGEVAAEP